MFPHPSVAVQVLLTLYDPAHAPGVVTSFDVKVNVLPHASIAVATANTGTAGQLIVDIAGSGAITGASVSMTWIVCEAVDAFSQASVAVQVLVTLYDPVQAPLVIASLKFNVIALPQASIAVATANSGNAGQLIVEGAGKAPITGAVKS